jgi:hypothetical protein
MRALSNTSDLELLRLQTTVIDDFNSFVDGTGFTKTAADSGASVAQTAGAANGVVALTTGGTDNNEAYLASAAYLIWSATKAIEFVAGVQYSEANTDDANVTVGLMSAVGANSILDDGAGPKASYSGAVFFKADGSTVWSVETSESGVQTTSVTQNTAGGAAQQQLKINVVPIASGVAAVTFFVDGKQCRDATTGALIEHRVAYSSPTAMSAFAGVKAGGANSEVLSVDYIATAINR